MSQTLTPTQVHFDGEQIWFDIDIELKPNTRLFITILPEEVHNLQQTRGAMRISEPSFARVWDNDEDAFCDRL